MKKSKRTTAFSARLVASFAAVAHLIVSMQTVSAINAIGVNNRVVAIQDNIVGKVRNEDGEPLSGVTVTVKQSNRAVTTDADGNYSISVPHGRAVLVFTMVGYLSKDVEVGESGTYDVVLTSATYDLDQVVVIGYGTVKKRDLTGAISSIKRDDIADFPITNITQALQGRAAGVQVLRNTGSPGGTVQVRIRGTNSILGSSDPLWIIDGFPGDQNTVNPEDIESIEILKDASATAIYGSRGANGVVLVTTKQGKKGTSRVDFSASHTSQGVRKKLDVMDAGEFMQFININRRNNDLPDYFSPSDIESAGEGTDWQDLIFRNAPIATVNASVSGGTDRTRYFLSGGYYDEQGIMINNYFKRYNLRTNVDHEISAKFKLSLNANLTRSQRNNNIGDVGNALIAPPTLSPYNEDGTYRQLNTAYEFSHSGQINPLALAQERYEITAQNNVFSNLGLTYQPIKDLFITVSGSVQTNDGKVDSYTSTKYPNSEGQAGISVGQTLNLSSNNIVEYSKSLKDHRFTVMGAMTYEKQRYTSLGISGTGFLSDVFQTHQMAAADIINVPSSAYSTWELLSYLSRVNYSFKDNYLLTASFRADGSSRYSEGNKWGYFPSAAVAWRVSGEEFMKSIPVISNLKLRASYGETGNTAIAPYSTLVLLQTGKTVLGTSMDYTFYSPGTRYPGNLRWETTAQTDFGLEIGFLHERFRLAADYYIKNTRDLLNSVQMPRSTGYADGFQNIGKMQNKGLEIQLDAGILRNEFKWDIGGNISFNRNKVVELYDGQDVTGSTLNVTIIQDYLNLLRESHPISAFYGYVGDGFDATGRYQYKDLNDDGVINSNDKTFIGNPNPNFTYGINSQMSYRNFTLGIFVQGSQGNDIYALRYATLTHQYVYGINTLRDVLYNHWTPETPNAAYPVISAVGTSSLRMSDRFVYDGSYLRVRNIELGYNLPLQKAPIKWIKQGRIYVSGQNLITLTDYPWFDPDVNTMGGGTSLDQGVDFQTYPNTKSVTVGFNLTF